MGNFSIVDESNVSNSPALKVTRDLTSKCAGPNQKAFLFLDFIKVKFWKKTSFNKFDIQINSFSGQTIKN